MVARELANSEIQVEVHTEMGKTGEGTEEGRE